MNSQSSLDHPEASAASASAESSPGAMIREARTRLRMSVEDLAAATKLARHTLEALERDDFNALQEAVYVRGYYRKCAKILNLSETRLAEAYQGRVAPKRPDPPTKLRLASGTDIGVANPLPVPMAVGSAVAAVIIGILLWNLFKSSPEVPRSETPLDEPITVAPPAAAPETPSPQVPTAPESLVPAPDAPPAAPAAGAAATVAAPAAGAAPAPAAAAAPANVPPTVPVTAGRPLTLKFSSTSWARVEDASGRVLVNGLMREGQVQQLSGQPPFAVFLGNGPGVQIEFDAKAVDFTRHVSDNLTARFRVPDGP